jgi:transcriptional regulator with XRE-family HTH domain
MTKAHTQLIERLEQKRQALGLNHYQFSSRLGIRHGTWNWVRLGVANPGLRVLAGIVQAFPELNHEVITFLVNFKEVDEKSQKRAS